MHPTQRGLAQQAKSDVSASDVRRAITNAVQKSGGKHGLLIDPRITDQIFSNSILYMGNFCSIPEENCDALFTNASRLDGLVEEYILEMSALPSGKIRSLADRLARGRMASTGWSSHIRVEAGRVEIPIEFRSNSISLRYATESIVLGVGDNAIVMAPGSAELLVEIAGKLQHFPVIVERLKTTKLQTVASSQGNLPGGALQPASTAYCWSKEQPPFTGPFALFNFGRATFAEPEAARRANEAPFTRQSVLAIKVEQDKEIQCGTDCKTALASLFAEAVATWRSGCERCDPNAMTMITTMGSTWLDWRIVRRLNSLAEKPMTHLRLDQVEGDERAITPPSPMGGSQQVQHYVNVSDDTIIQHRICKLNDGAAPWVASVKGHLCPDAPAREKELLNPVVMLKQAATSCGEGAAACGLPLERVEISLSKYRYALPTNHGQGDIVIGRNKAGGVLEMRKVILHEVGHWFGVPHAQVGGENKFLDVMGEAYDDGEDCVSVHSLRMLTNAADIRWTYRAKNGGALLGPRRERLIH